MEKFSVPTYLDGRSTSALFFEIFTFPEVMKLKNH
jgi:hypothetical protein